MNAKRFLVVALAMLLMAASGALAQVPPPPIVMTPHPNPISSLVLPAPGEVPVSPVTPGTSPGSLGGMGGTGCCYGTHQIVGAPLNNKAHAYHRRRHHPAS
jgi:hypothetical protein